MADLDQMNVQMDVSALVREEIITDRKIGTIRVLTPVTVDGTRDFARDVVYMGETQIMTQMGPLPISFQIKAATLEEAKVMAKQPRPVFKKLLLNWKKCAVKPPARS